MLRVLVTRPRAHPAEGAFAAGLRAAGCEPIFFPVIEIRPLGDAPALENLAAYDWLVLTSVYAVEMLWKLPALRQPLPGHLRVASIGPQTAQALRRRGVEPDFVPGEYVAEAILPGLGDLRGRSVLLPCAELARRDLPDGILAAGGVVDVVPLYQTLLPARADPAGLAALKSGVDVITLTSPSTVQNFVLLAREQGLDPLDLPGGPVFACIGPITRQAAEVERLPRLLVAAEYTGAGLIRAIQSIYSSL